MRKLLAYFVDKPLIVNILTIFVLAAAVLLYQRIPKEGYPAVDEPGVTITAAYPGASPEDIELNVTIPIEDVLDGLEGIREYYSTSNENSCYIVVLFDDDVEDLDQKKQELRRELDAIRTFPAEMRDRPQIHEWGGKHADIVRIGICGDTISERELQRRSQDLKDRLLALPAISKVEEWGKREREVHIEINLKKQTEYKIAFEDIINAIQSHNIKEKNGTLRSYTSEKDIVTLSRFENNLDVGNVILRSDFDGHQIKLSDIADVRDTFAEEYSVLRFNGNRGIVLSVHKKNKEDIIKAVAAVNQVVREYEQQAGDPDLDIAVIRDRSEVTRSRLNVVRNNAVLGLVLVIVILFFFLSFKNAFWTALGIPFSICFGLIFFSAFDVTINSISLLGIIIILGMVVDDAIVISENIYRHKMQGGKGYGSAVDATYEVSFAVITTVATTVLVFVPFYFMKGEIGTYAREIPIILTFVMLGSLLEAFFILPNHVSHPLKKHQKLALGFVIGAVITVVLAKALAWPLWQGGLAVVLGGAVFAAIFFKLYREDEEEKEKPYILAMRKGYGRCLLFILRHRGWILAVIALLGAGGVWLFKSMPFEMFPQVEADMIELEAKTADIHSLEHTKEVVGELEHYVKEKYDQHIIKSIITIAGQQGKPEAFKTYIQLVPESKRRIKSGEIVAAIRAKMKSMGGFEEVEINSYDSGPTLGSNIRVDILANDDHKRGQVAGEIEQELKAMPGMKHVQRSDNETKREIRILPDYDKVARYGVTAKKISEILSIAYNGYVVTYLQTPEVLMPYRLLLKEKDRRDIDTIKRLEIKSTSGKLIPLKNVVQIEEGETQTSIKHYQGYRRVSINAEIDPKVETPAAAYQRLREKYKGVQKQYPGVQVHIGGAAERSSETLHDLFSILFVVVLAVFVLLILLFRSISQPLIVMSVLPFGALGVALAFKWHGMPLSFMGLVGFIGLSGVVVNDSLVMVDYINQLKRKFTGNNIFKLVIHGAVTRMRPVLMTTLTTFIGLIPAAYGFGGKDAMILPTAMAISWGLLFSTGITLVMVPLFYTIEYDVKKRMNRWLEKLD